MYQKLRFSIVGPVRFMPILRLLLLTLGVLLVAVTILLLVLWRQAIPAQTAPSDIYLCHFEYHPDMNQRCGPTEAEIALPGEYAHAALATSAVGVGCFIGAYMLGRRSQTK